MALWREVGALAVVGRAVAQSWSGRGRVERPSGVLARGGLLRGQARIGPAGIRRIDVAGRAEWSSDTRRKGLGLDWPRTGEVSR